MEVRPARSVRTPQEAWCAAGATGMRSVRGSTPMARQDAVIVGKRRARSGRCRASRKTWSVPAARSCRKMPFATTSRGASSCCPTMKRLPSPSTRYAPSPRNASDTSGCWSSADPPTYNAVGWNCTNSMSVTSAPARRARATPSPVDTTGLVVAAKTWPIPPVASTTARARTAPTPSSVPSPSTCSVTPQARPARSRSRSRTSACSTRRIHGSRRTAACNARCTSAPVASPPAWTIRLAWCPPSRVSMSVPSGYRSKSAPQRISSRTRAGPSVTSTSVRPATPDPTTTTSVGSAQPGSGARSRRGNGGRSIRPVLDTASPGQRAGTEIANRATQRRVRRGVAAEGLVAGGADIADLEIGAGGVGRQAEVGERDLAAALGHRRLDRLGVEGRVVRGDPVCPDELPAVRFGAGGVPDRVAAAGHAGDGERPGVAGALEAAGARDVPGAAGSGGLHQGAAEEPVAGRLDPVGEQGHLVVVPVAAEVDRRKAAARPADLREHEVGGDLGRLALGLTGLADQAVVDLADVVDLGGVRRRAVPGGTGPRQRVLGRGRLDRPAPADRRRVGRRFARDRLAAAGPPHHRDGQQREHADGEEPRAPQTRHADPSSYRPVSTARSA